MWRLEIQDRRKDLLFYGWFPTSREAGEFVENTLELFLIEQAVFYTLTDGKRRIEYLASDVASCLKHSGLQPFKVG